MVFGQLWLSYATTIGPFYRAENGPSLPALTPLTKKTGFQLSYTAYNEISSLNMHGIIFPQYINIIVHNNGEISSLSIVEN